MTPPKPASAPPADALLPCPFCGNPNVTDDEGCFPLNHEHSRWEVRCGNPSCYAHEQQGATREEATAKWNRRAVPAAEPLPLPRHDEACNEACGDGCPNKPAAEPVPVAQGDDPIDGVFRTMPDGATFEEYRDALAVGTLTAVDQMGFDNLLHDHLEALEASLAACRAELQEMADHGLRFDLNPTHDASNAEEFWHGYIRQADRSIRERAAAVLPLAGEVANG